jgi:hypothetical protein
VPNSSSHVDLNKGAKKALKRKVYQVEQISGVPEHLTSIADHLENSCSVMQQIRTSFAARLPIF